MPPEINQPTIHGSFHTQGFASIWMERVAGSVTIDKQTIKAKCELIGEQFQLDSDVLDTIFVTQVSLK
jgi:hypothetical protein